MPSASWLRPSGCADPPQNLLPIVRKARELMATKKTTPVGQLVACLRLCQGLAGVLMGIACFAGPSPADEPPTTRPIDFAHDITPLIKSHCAKCHTDGTYKGSFSLDTRETMLKSKAVVPGKSGESELIERLTSDDPEFRMPPKGPRLTAGGSRPVAGMDRPEGALGRWLYVQAPDLRGAAQAAPAQAARRPGWPRPSDRSHRRRLFPLARRVAAAPFGRRRVCPPGLPRRDRPAAAGPRAGGVSRKTPRPTNARAWSAGCCDDRRAYADHWLSFWNDLLRNDYAGTGYIDGGRKQITDWLYRALTDNIPYDRFVRELISPSAESEGFIKGIKWRGSVNASQVRRSSSRRTSRRSSSEST